jgi:cobalt-zinc-cadmium efflux system protein
MGHDHQHEATSHGRAFALGVGLNLAFVVVEVIYGLRADSLALVADAGHNLSDVLGLLLAWGAAVLARRLPTPRRTYGMRRSSVLAALANAMLLLVAVGAIAWEAVQRLSRPAPINTTVVIWVAAIGIMINTATALLFMAGRKRDLNIKGAFLHMAADAGVSAGVVVAGLAIAATGWVWLDPVISLVIVVVILVGTWGLLRDSVNLAMDAVPEGIDPRAVQEYLSALPGVVEVHDLHIWGMSTTDVALTAHLVRPAAENDDAFLVRACRELHDRFGIEHAALQIERGGGEPPCSLAPAHVI